MNVEDSDPATISTGKLHVEPVGIISSGPSHSLTPTLDDSVPADKADDPNLQPFTFKQMLPEHIAPGFNIEPLIKVIHFKKISVPATLL